MIGLIAAHAFERATLQDPKDLCLRGGRHITDFIQEKGAAVALLELAHALVRGAGERAALMPEQFALQKVLRDRGAVDGDERFLASLAVPIDRAGDQFLARATFARDQRSRITHRELADEFEHVLHRLGPAHDCRCRNPPIRGGAGSSPPLHGARRFKRVENERLEFRDVEGLQHVVVGAELHRFDGRLRGAIGRHDDDR